VNAPAGVIRMTEDGRRFEAAAPCGPDLGFVDRGHRDARLDAITSSLWMQTFAVSHPKRDDAVLRMGHPTLVREDDFVFSTLHLKEITYENVPGK